MAMGWGKAVPMPHWAPWSASPFSMGGMAWGWAAILISTSRLIRRATSSAFAGVFLPRCMKCPGLR